MKRDHRSRVMMVFTLNVDESKEDLVMGGCSPLSAVAFNAHILNTLTIERMGLQFGTKREGEECSHRGPVQGKSVAGRNWL